MDEAPLTAGVGLCRRVHVHRLMVIDSGAIALTARHPASEFRSACHTSWLRCVAVSDNDAAAGPAFNVYLSYADLI